MGKQRLSETCTINPHTLKNWQCQPGVLSAEAYQETPQDTKVGILPNKQETGSLIQEKSKGNFKDDSKEKSQNGKCVPRPKGRCGRHYQ